MLAGLFRLTGAGSDRDFQMANATRLAIAELASISPRPIGMVICDTAGDPTQATHSLEEAVRAYQAVGLVGPTTDLELEELAPTAISLGVLVISPSAGAPDITNLVDDGLVWRTAASDLTQVPVLLGLVQAPTMLDIAYVDLPYGIALSQAFSQAWAQSAGSPPPLRKFEPSTSGETVLAALRNDNPNYSVVVTDPDDTPALVGALDQVPGDKQLGATQFLFTDQAKVPGLIGTDATVNARMRGTGPAAPSGPTFATFGASYQAQYQSDPGATPYVANTYDATYALALAVASVPSSTPVTGAKMAEAMGRMSTPGMLVPVGPASFASGAQALLAGMAIDLDGASSPLTWDPKTGDVTDVPIEVWGINSSGQFCTFDAAGDCQ